MKMEASKMGSKPNCRPQVGNKIVLHKTPKMQNKAICFAPMQNNSKKKERKLNE